MTFRSACKCRLLPGQAVFQVLDALAKGKGRRVSGLEPACSLPYPRPPSVNGTGNSPVSGTADPRSSQTGQVIRGLR